MDNFIKIFLSDQAIIIYELLGIGASLTFWVFFSKHIKKYKIEQEQGSRKKKYSDLENSLTNDKRR